MKWHFSRKRPSDKTRDPVASEFFASDAIKDAGEALVREGIQNSLDARLDASGVCRIRIYLSAERGAIDAERHAPWFETAWPHYMAPKNGLKPGAIEPQKKCRYLVFEDFETTGLTGDSEQHNPIDGQKNDFFHFFRAEGKTEKGGDDRGRWGIGKQVFPRSSRAQTFFGYSETSEGPALMGGCILKHHLVQDVCFKPDGYFGEQRQVDDDILTMPIRDVQVIERFRRDFNLNRKPGQTGLSIVVPWLDDGDDEDRGNQGFSRSALIIAAISGYFIPILDGKLEVLIEDHVGSDRINRDTYQDILLKLEASGEEKLKSDVRRLRAYLYLCETANAGNVQEFTLPPCSQMKAEWSDTMLSEAQAQSMREALGAGSVIRVKSTLTVRPRGGPDASDSFICLVSRKDNFAERPCHIREDLRISDVMRSSISGFVCLVRVNRGPLATLLGDSESISHTEWQRDSKNFKGKYTYGGIVIEFVSSFAHQLVRRIHANSKQLDRKLLVDLFYDEVPEQATTAAKRKKAEKPKIDGPGPIPDPEVSEIRITETKDGFTMGPAGAPFRPGSKILVRVAYETSKGNPLKAYKIHDFDLKSGSISIEPSGCEVVGKAENKITVRVNDPGFALHVSGFDTNRDLVVKANLERNDEAVADSPEAHGN